MYAARGEVIVIARGVCERADWVKIRAEYIAGGLSYRKLAKKYGISETSIGKRGRAENWAADREAARRRSYEKTIQKTADVAAENAVKALRIKTRLLDRLERLVENALDATEVRSYDDTGALTEINRLRDLTAAYKDLTDDMPSTTAMEDALKHAKELLGGVKSAVE